MKNVIKTVIVLACCVSCLTMSYKLSAASRDPEKLSPWEDQYSDTLYTTPQKTSTFLNHHSQQNIRISGDFLRQIQIGEESRIPFLMQLSSSKRLLEIGCGSGEMLQLFAQRFPQLEMVGLDISGKAIEYAHLHNKYQSVAYYKFDCLQNNIQDHFPKFNLAICSNTLEHFKQPFVLLEKILAACDFCILLVPYKQPLTDGYDMEGGLGHVYTFDENSFKNYTIVSRFIFQTQGWQYSSRGEKPLQLAILLTK